LIKGLSVTVEERPQKSWKAWWQWSVDRKLLNFSLSLFVEKKFRED